MQLLKLAFLCELFASMYRSSKSVQSMSAEPSTIYENHHNIDDRDDYVYEDSGRSIPGLMQPHWEKPRTEETNVASSKMNYNSK